MKRFAAELAEFLRRHYPEAAQDGWYRFSADINIVGGEVEVEIPVLTRLPDVFPIRTGKAIQKADPKPPLPTDDLS